MITSFIQSLQKQVITPPQSKNSFKPGQIFQGRILKLFPNQVAEIQVGSQKLIAKLEVPLLAGTKYWFQVQSGEGKIHLKVLPMEDAGANTKRSITGLLSQLNLPLTKENQDLLAFFLKEQLPFSKETFSSAVSLLKDMNPNKDSLQVLKEMITKNLPITKDVFQGLLANVKNEPLHRIMHNVQTLLSEGHLTKNGHKLLSLLNELTMTGQDRTSEKIVGQLIKLWMNQNTNSDNLNALGILQKFSLIENKSEGQLLQQAATRLVDGANHLSLSENGKNRLNQAIQQNQPELVKVLVKHTVNTELEQGTKPEGAVVRNILALFNEDNLQPAKGTPLSSILKTEAEPLLSKQEASLLNKVLNESEEGRTNWDNGKIVGEQLKSLVGKIGFSYEHTLVQLLKDGKQIEIQNLNVLKALVLSVLTEGPPPSLRDASEQLLSKLNGIQLQSQESAPLQQYVMQVPVALWKKTTDLTIQWNGRKKENGQIDPDYCRVLFYLELEYLNEVMVDMQIQNRIMNITIINDIEGIQAVAKPFMDELREKLSEQGFKLSHVAFRKSEEEKVKVHRKGVTPYYESSTYSGVDIKI